MIRLNKMVKMLTVLALTATVMAGCGSKDNAGTEVNPAASPAASTKPVEFQFYFTGSQNVKDLWDTLVPMFEKQNSNVKVKTVYIPSGTGADSTYDRILAAKKKQAKARVTSICMKMESTLSTRVPRKMYGRR